VIQAVSTSGQVAIPAERTPAPTPVDNVEVTGGRSGRFRRRLWYSQLASKLKEGSKAILHRVEIKHGYFLPYHLSVMRDDEFFHEVRRLAKDQDVTKALVVGAASGEGCTEAVLAGVRESRRESLVFCVNSSTRRFLRLRHQRGDRDGVRYSPVASGDGKAVSEAVEVFKAATHRSLSTLSFWMLPVCARRFPPARRSDVSSNAHGSYCCMASIAPRPTRPTIVC
jgi:hypothetical protein